jgi:hypothetical protein
MGAEGLIGSGPSSIGFFDPWKLSEGKDDSTIRWYRAAELKHGRVCMLASLGIIFQSFQSGILPNPAFSEPNAFKAIQRVYHENPGALIQV